MRPFKKIKRTAVYLLLKAIIGLFNMVPRPLAIYVGGWLGWAAWWLSPHDRYKTVRHLSLVYGNDIPHQEKLNIGRTFFINSGKNMADVLRFKKHFKNQIKPLVSVEGMEHFRQAWDQGKGVIGITGHIGNFELLAAYIQSEGYDSAVVGRELYDVRLDRLLLDNRESVGLTTIATTDSPKRIIAWLKTGKVLGVLIDTDSHRVRGEFIPAFGRWSYTPIGQTLLGLKTGAAFVPIACLRTPGNRYRIVIKPAIEYQPTGEREADVYAVTRKCTQALEGIIREHLDQWPWQHNRWRTRRQPNA